MAKKLSLYSTEDMRKEMSIAGSPEKITKLMGDIEHLMFTTIDANNPAELMNTKFALQRLIAEIKVRSRILERRNNQKYNI